MSAPTDLNTVYPWIKSYPPGVAWNAPIPVRPAFALMEDARARYGDRPAFDFLGKIWTWKQAADMAENLAAGLQDLGVGKGVQVGLLMPNCFYFLVAYYAVLRAGGTVVNFNPLYSIAELRHQVEDSQTDIMITLDLKLLYPKARDVMKTTRLKKLVVGRFTDMLPFPKNILFALLKGKDIARGGCPHDTGGVWLHDLVSGAKPPAPVAIDPQNDIAVLQYTGGTTGVPKGAALTHANITANTEQTVMWLNKAKPGEGSVLGVLPFFHVFAMTAIMNLAVRNGFKIIALPRFDIDTTLKTIDREKPDMFPAVPAIYNAINNHPKRRKFDLSSLKFCISGGAPLPVEVKKAFEDNTGCVVVEGYGLSESSPIVCANPLEGVNKAGSIGLPFPSTIVEIVSTEDGQTVLPTGERGELCVRGPQVMKGYWNKPEETAKVLKNGRLHTGDVGIIDEDGYVRIVDRIKDMIITNGYKVYPRNVEEAIYLHPAVEECIVAGIPDDARGEIVKAWIKPKDGYDIAVEDLKKFLSVRLSPMEMPRQIEIREKPLPKTMVGKLSRKDILAEERTAKIKTKENS